MSGTVFLHHHSMTLLPSRPSISENLMFLISEYGAALPMFIFSEISKIPSNLTTRSVSLLDTLQVTKAGSFITQSQSEL
jgi:hypothetical protein